MQKIKEAILSSKCQITVPKAIRDILQVECGDSLAFYIEDGQVVLTNLNNINVKLKDKNKKTIVKRGK
ncbi:MAG: AbrB family transcriptional regulator [Clostridia bacterium]|nr:AbrB family transcriptional regulator [Clostridia bacterium]